MICIDIDEDELDNIDDMGEGNNILLNGDLANEENQVNTLGDYQHENQQKMFGANQDNENNDQNDNNNNKKSLSNNMERKQLAENINNNNVSNGDSTSKNNVDH